VRLWSSTRCAYSKRCQTLKARSEFLWRWPRERGRASETALANIDTAGRRNSRAHNPHCEHRARADPATGPSKPIEWLSTLKISDLAINLRLARFQPAGVTTVRRRNHQPVSARPPARSGMAPGHFTKGPASDDVRPEWINPPEAAMRRHGSRTSSRSFHACTDAFSLAGLAASMSSRRKAEFHRIGRAAQKPPKKFHNSTHPSHTAAMPQDHQGLLPRFLVPNR